MADSKMEIDDSLYSRQRYMLGDQAMKRMASSTVVLIGCDCLGVEIAKNLALTGVGKLLIADKSVVTKDDIRSNFYISQSHLEKKSTRAEACVPKISELNPYVSAQVSTADVLIASALQGDSVAEKALKEVIEKTDCLVGTQCNLKSQKYLNKLCRESSRHTRFVESNVYGLFSSVFCDFGENFEVVDATGETPKEAFIAKISKQNPGVVTCSENKIHGLEDGDFVLFREVQGMEELNGKVRQVKVVSPYAFTIGDTSNLSQYVRGGIIKQVKMKSSVSHESLETQLLKPDLVIADLGKLENPAICHAAFVALSAYEEENDGLPQSWNQADSEKLIKKYKEAVQSSSCDAPIGDDAIKIVTSLSFTARGVLPSLGAAIGGIAAQEVLKSLTGKYTPLKQWLYLDATELLENLLEKPEVDHLGLSPVERCLGKKAAEYLAKLNVFMVGCGAIGCEMLKNLALLGVSSTKSGGKITVTDNDVIEKSNLNRQFLFRSKHVGQFKSSIAALSAIDINPDMRIHSMQHKVGPGTEQTVFNDAFFESNHIIINALDNVQARRFMDARCVTNQRPLLESGTMGPKGHVQVIVPFATESYSSQQDPADVQYPFCTLKSFPSQIEHTIQWARDKFEVLFSQKPMTYNKFWDGCFKTVNRSDGNFIGSFSKFLDDGGRIQDAVIAVKLLTEGPQSWNDCLSIARCRFEKFFNHKARNLLQAFPLDTKLDDGSPFWSLPKRPPTAIIFDVEDQEHMLFVISFASLLAAIYGIKIPSYSKDEISAVLAKTIVPNFVPSNKEIITDENIAVPKSPAVAEEVDIESLCRKLNSMTKSDQGFKFQVFPQDFEKDDDSNHHIDFISSSANLRARMYGIETVDRLEVKRIAGRIIPAISTTTSAVSGFATIQFLQVVLQAMRYEAEGKRWSDTKADDVDMLLSKYRNCFMNLALPLFLFSEPAAARRTVIKQGLSFTEWDRWNVCGNKDFKLKDLIQHFKSKHGLNVSAVLHGSKMVYIPIMPGHSKRLDHPMTKFVKATGEAAYVDLTITLEGPSGGDEDLSCPPVRYHF